MIKHNYHTHTKLCNHATMSAEEVIKTAIANGLETIGISEHMLLEGDYNEFRIASEDEQKIFIDQLNFLKIKYQKQIKVLCGFECELIHPYTHENIVNYAAQKKKIPGVDYLIIGHHNFPSGGHVFDYMPTSIKEIDQYLAFLEEALKSRAFAYIAHPDGFFSGAQGQLNEYTQYLAHQICQLAQKYQIPLGVNVNGVRGFRAYPSKHFWQIAAQYNLKALIELDAHDQECWDPHYYHSVVHLLEEVKIKPLVKLNLK